MMAPTLDEMHAQWVEELSPAERARYDALPEGTRVRYAKAHPQHNPHLRRHLGQAGVVTARWADYSGVTVEVAFTESDWAGYGRTAPRFALRPRYLEVSP